MFYNTLFFLFVEMKAIAVNTIALSISADG